MGNRRLSQTIADCHAPQNSTCLKLYWLSSLLDEHPVRDVNSFRSQYTGAGSILKLSGSGFRPSANGHCETRSRNISATPRRPLTRPFRPTDDEHDPLRAVRLSCNAKTATPCLNGNGI